MRGPMCRVNRHRRDGLSDVIDFALFARNRRPPAVQEPVGAVESSMDLDDRAMVLAVTRSLRLTTYDVLVLLEIAKRGIEQQDDAITRDSILNILEVVEVFVGTMTIRRSPEV